MHNMKTLWEALPKFTAFLASDCSPPPHIKNKDRNSIYCSFKRERVVMTSDKSMLFPTEFSFFLPTLKNYNNFTMSPREWAHENARSRQHEEKSLVIYFRRQQMGLSAALWAVRIIMYAFAVSHNHHHHGDDIHSRVGNLPFPKLFFVWKEKLF